MTRKKIADPLISPLQIKLFRLREMALKVVSTKFEPDQKGGPFLTNPEREFLAVALWRTGHGVDINEAFGVKATRGEHRKLNDRAHIEDRLLSPLRRRLSKLRDMALNIVSSRLKARRKGGLVLSEHERDFLAVALDSIGHGAMANEAFGVKATRGERRTLKEAAKSDNIRFVMSWIAQKITTEENEYFTRRGISVKDALAAAAENFRYEDWSLRTYWFNHPELHSSSFDRPITSLPLRTRKRSLR
jgi:hypothetical protein